MEKITSFIRGIYTTALTKLFLDHNYEIIYPSEKIQKRFKIPYRGDKYSKDIVINDRYDKQGISLSIKKNVFKKLRENEFKNFPLSSEQKPHIIKLNSNFNVNDIYYGEVIKSSKKKNFSFIKLKPGEQSDNVRKKEDYGFKTNLGYFNSFLKVETKGIFQVRNEDYGTHAAQLVKDYTLPGDLLVLIPDENSVYISKKIESTNERDRLIGIGDKLLQGKNFGIICRTAAKSANEREIKNEFDKLETTYKQIQDLISKIPDRIARIYSQTKSINLLFPYNFKNQLNEIRNEIISTINYHHTIKSTSPNNNKMGSYYADEGVILDYTEDLMEKLNKEEKAKIENFYLDKYFERIQNGSWMHIDHVKLTGKIIHLRGGRIEKFEKKENKIKKIILRREFSKEGKFDGLDIPIEKGDYSISTFNEGEWYYINEYYSIQDESKGKYININSPIEISNRNIQYIDLEVDLIENTEGERKIIDKEEFEKIVDLNIISKPIYEKIKILIKNLKNFENKA